MLVVGSSSSASPSAGGFKPLLTSPIWRKLSRFDLDYPPFDFNSGMGVDPVDYEEARRHGLVIPEATLEGADGESLNASLEVEGERTTVRTAVEQGIYRHSVFVRIPPGQSIDLRWRLESTLPPGSYDLTLVRPANGGATETNVVVREGDRNVIDETVAPGRTVRLTTNP